METVFDPAQATQAYIDGLGPDALAKAAAYTIGNHWLLLWGLLVAALVTWLIVKSGVLNRVDARFADKRKSIKAFSIALVFFLVSAVLTLPWEIYADWMRESRYDRTSQPLTDWLGQGAIGVALSAVFGAIFFALIYLLIRKVGRLWWVWASGLTAAAICLLMLASPILIEPLFNDYQPVPDGEVRDALIAMADDAGIAHDRLFMYDGSRQSNNFTANVAGIGSSARIAISDVAIGEASLDEVKAVTGHEVGHYVSGHIWNILGTFVGLSLVFFFLVDRLFPAFARMFGAPEAMANPVGLPVFLFMIVLLSTLMQPVVNAVTRIGEIEADQYALETVGLPDALASALVKTAEYRNPRPGRLAEVLFYTHPSVERRVRMAMDWKAAHPDGLPSDN